MRWFHRHRWVQVRRKAVRGAQENRRPFEFEGVWDEAASDALYGYTIIEQRCEVCGLRRVEKFTGAMEG